MKTCTFGNLTCNYARLSPGGMIECCFSEYCDHQLPKDSRGQMKGKNEMKKNWENVEENIYDRVLKHMMNWGDLPYWRCEDLSTGITARIMEYLREIN